MVALLMIDDPAFCSRWRQCWWSEEGLLDVALIGKREEHGEAFWCYLLFVYYDTSTSTSVGLKRKLLLDMQGGQLMPVAATLGEEERKEGSLLLLLLV